MKYMFVTYLYFDLHNRAYASCVSCVCNVYTCYLNRQKYSALVESKAEQSRDLIAAEEGRLDVSKALLDLKLEHSRLQVYAKLLLNS
jgi:hypothetical protein